MFIGGCAGTRPAKFYTLNSIEVSDTQRQVETGNSGVAVGIGPIRFPDYLERQQIVTRSSRNQLEVAEFHRWAGSLKEDFSRVLAENLSVLLLTDRIALFPWKSTTRINYRVTIDVIRFEGAIGGDVTLKTRWTILGGGEKKVLMAKKSNLTESVEGDNYDGLVSAKSNALESLSREIAQAIHTIFQQRRD
jgi:uncharacterized lipoprotein YmbA